MSLGPSPTPPKGQYATGTAETAINFFKPETEFLSDTGRRSAKDIMIPAAILLQTLAFYMLYNTSKRAALPRDTASQWLQQHARVAGTAGLVLLVVSFSMLIFACGPGVGILTGFLGLMAIGGIIIMLVPLKSKKI